MPAIKLMIINAGPSFLPVDPGKSFNIVGELGPEDEVVAKVLALKPDVILLDTDLPAPSGIDLITELKTKNPALKILAITCETDQYHLSQIIKAGALGYVLKELDQTTLIEAIRTVARGDAYIQPCLLSKLVNEFRHFLSQESTIMLPAQFGLTQRELEIISYIAYGKSNKDIAERLFISEKTVKNHVSNILRKMALEDRTQVAVYAHRKGLIIKHG